MFFDFVRFITIAFLLCLVGGLMSWVRYSLGWKERFSTFFIWAVNFFLVFLMFWVVMEFSAASSVFLLAVASTAGFFSKEFFLFFFGKPLSF